MKINKLKTIIENFSNNSIDYDVFIIANTHNIDKETKQWNYEHSTLDEFFSRQEFSEISSAIYNIFGFVKVFYSELEFVEYVMKRDVDRDNLIVINFSRDGKKEGKKSLIPAFCDLLGIKYTGSNAFVISLLRNKFVFSNFFTQFLIWNQSRQEVIHLEINAPHVKNILVIRFAINGIEKNKKL